MKNTNQAAAGNTAHNIRKSINAIIYFLSYLSSFGIEGVKKEMNSSCFDYKALSLVSGHNDICICVLSWVYSCTKRTLPSKWTLNLSNGKESRTCSNQSKVALSNHGYPRVGTVLSEGYTEKPFVEQVSFRSPHSTKGSLLECCSTLDFSSNLSLSVRYN